MQIGEVGGRARRTVQRFDVGRQLNQVARDKSREARFRSVCTSSHAVSRHEPLFDRSVSSQVCTPGSMRITCQFGRATSRRALPEIDGANSRTIDSGQQFGVKRTERSGGQERPQLFGKYGIVAKRERFRRRLKKKIERIDDRHFRHEVDFDRQFSRLFGKDESGQKLPCGSCCPLTNCFSGSTFSE